MGPLTRGCRCRRRLPLLLVLLAVAVLTQAAPAWAALPPFVGGPVPKDCPTVIANDHTVNALRFSASGLTPNTTYYVKLRFSPNLTPSGADNRGYTWNGASGKWVQERTVDPASGQTDWTQFPTITTDSTGAFAPGPSDWMYVKFGDTTKTGTYYLLVSVSLGTSGTTTNCDTPIRVSVLDARTAAYTVHAGPATMASTKRADVVTQGDVTATPLSLTRTEPNLCDDDANGVVDDEQYGLVKPGGFRLAAPIGPTVDARVQNAVWPVGSAGVASTVPDVDIALGGTDTTPPSAPASLSMTTGGGSASLAWTPATDDTGVTTYDIYRWTPAPADAGFTAQPQLLAALPATTTTYTDTGLAPGTDYAYTVRARDAATNVGPRATLAVTLTLVSQQSVVAWKAPATLTADLTANDDVVNGRQVVLERSFSGTDEWAALGAAVDVGATISTVPTRATYYRLTFAGDAEYAPGVSNIVKVAPRVKLGTPVAPKSVRKGAKFAVYGSLVPKQEAGANNVKVKCYRKTSGGKWVLKKTAAAKNTSYGTYTRYKVKLCLPSKGSWKLVASYAATVKYASATSGARILRVK